MARTSETVAAKAASAFAATPLKGLPKTPGGMIDFLYEKREARLKLQRELEAVKSEEEAIEQYILETLGKQELEGAKGKLATASVSRKVVPKLDDFDTFMKWAVKKPDRWTCLHKRLAVTAIAERWENKEDIPGVSSIPVTKLSLTKR